MSEVMNIKEFAKVSGYSPASISRAFSNKSRISAATANEIVRLAQEYNFRPNRVSAAAFGHRTHSVGVLLYSLTNSYFIDIYNGIRETMNESSYLTIYQEITGEDNYQTLARLVDHRVDGIIMIDISRCLTPTEKAEIKRMKLLLIMIDHSTAMPEVDQVNTDDDKGGRMLANYLLGLGHRHFISTSLSNPKSNNIRNSSFQEEVKNAGGINEICYLPETPEWKEKFEHDLISQLCRSDRPTAVFAYNDTCALEVYRIARKLNLRIPDDISVVGYADLNIATIMYPELTTVRQDGYAVGQAAARIFMQRLKNPDAPVKSETIPVTLQIRDSCKKLA
jgi:LacI family transcriptional regulator